MTGLEETFVLSGLTVSPNPVRGALQIQFENTQQKPGQISIFNLQGQQVFMSTFPSEGSIKRDVQTQAWGTGLYLVKVSIDGKFLIKKVLKIE